MGPVYTGTPFVNDPLANLVQLIALSGMTVQSNSQFVVANNKTVALNPGVYKGGIKIGSGDTVTLNPGICYLQSGGLIVNGNSTVTDAGNGVLLYNAPWPSSDQINISGGAKVTLSPMTTGAYQGLVIFQAASSTNQVTQRLEYGPHPDRLNLCASATLSLSSGADLVINRGSSDPLGGIVVSNVSDTGGSAID